MSELKTLSSLLATSHTLLDRLTNETQDLQVWIDDTKTILELGEKAGTQQHRVKFQVGGSCGDDLYMSRSRAALIDGLVGRAPDYYGV